MYNIRKSFSAKLSLGILILTISIFAVSLGVLFTQSRHFIRVEAVGRATNVAKAKAYRLRGISHTATLERLVHTANH